MSYADQRSLCGVRHLRALWAFPCGRGICAARRCGPGNSSTRSGAIQGQRLKSGAESGPVTSTAGGVGTWLPRPEAPCAGSVADARLPASAALSLSPVAPPGRFGITRPFIFLVNGVIISGHSLGFLASSASPSHI